jgi:predicted glycosyltransferase
VVPRREQAIRAAKAEAAGLVTSLPIDAYPDVDLMVDALAALPDQAPPSEAGFHQLLNGLDAINARTEAILRKPRLARPTLSLVR